MPDENRKRAGLHAGLFKNREHREHRGKKAETQRPLWFTQAGFGESSSFRAFAPKLDPGLRRGDELIMGANFFDVIPAQAPDKSASVLNAPKGGPQGERSE